eukprot:TRINITY_DN6787_c0_g1_i2.p1 TRINITY_DN6787_c0_g1~~TRINITY_DN6787_c0_g1_i2.p1  ORF type:complete len:202 (+),score=32.86 TRINITY_DN6787_c0_g1_i2:138-743(+)
MKMILFLYIYDFIKTIDHCVNPRRDVYYALKFSGEYLFKGLYMTEVIHESSSRRRYFRLTAPIRVKYNGKEYLTENWSLGGFKIHEIDFVPEKDAVLEFTLGIPFQDYVLSAEQRARVVMYNPEEKSLACEFIEMNIRTSEMLKYFSDCPISGEMASIDPVSYTHLRAHETSLHLVCRLLLEKKKKNQDHMSYYVNHNTLT